jgi:peptide methionine sulfoxide reductase MsrA
MWSDKGYAVGLLLWLAGRPVVQAFHLEGTSSRRDVIKSLIAGGIGGEALFGTTLGRRSIARAQDDAVVDAVDETPIEVYFGCGCFWHVQHEFVEAERRILKRSDAELTARAGYAGGKVGALEGKVCYHNAAQIADYGKLGHAEVVRLSIPSWSFPQFAEEYFKLYNSEGYRPDQWGDVGPEYRNLVGLPGGVTSVFAKQLIATSQASGDKLDFAKGKGDDPDARALTFVMDTANYPFFVAEQYHQFHDGFNWGENYPNSYNDLAGKLAKQNVLGESKCPNGLLGLGALGL